MPTKIDDTAATATDSYRHRAAPTGTAIDDPLSDPAPPRPALHDSPRRETAPSCRGRAERPVCVARVPRPQVFPTAAPLRRAARSLPERYPRATIVVYSRRHLLIAPWPHSCLAAEEPSPAGNGGEVKEEACVGGVST